MISTAIVGLGRRSGARRDGPSQTASASCAAWSRDPARARDFAARHGLALTTSLAEAGRDPGIGAVFLATPHSLHVDAVVAAAAAGKAVWCETPLALTRAGAAWAGVRATSEQLTIQFDRKP